MKLPCVVYDGTRTAIAVSAVAGGGVKLLYLEEHKLVTKTGKEERWTPISDYPVRLALELYKTVGSATIQAREVESLLAQLAKDRSLVIDLTKYDRLERIMATAENTTAAKAPAKTKTAAAPKADKPAAAVKGQKAAAPAATKAPAKEKPAAAAKTPAKAAPAKAPAKQAAKAAPAEGTGRKGRPSSLDPASKIKKGENKVADFVRAGSVREALMNAIVESKTVGEALGKTLDSGHTVKSVDIHFAVQEGYITLG